MNDAQLGPSGSPDRSDPTDDPRSAWERALTGPPINPNSELIYPDHKPLRARHAR